MNTEDFETPELSECEDMLDLIFQRQRELMQKYESIEEKNFPHMYKDIPVDINSREGQARLKDFAWRITEELGEAMNTLKNKPWKQTHVITNEKHYLEEIGDAFHFFIELCILSGLDAKGLFDIYFRKSEVNHFRIRSNY